MRAAAKLGHSQVLTVHDQFEDRRVGVRMVTFVTPIQHLADGGQVGFQNTSSIIFQNTLPLGQARFAYSQGSCSSPAHSRRYAFVGQLACCPGMPHGVKNYINWN